MNDIEAQIEEILFLDLSLDDAKLGESKAQILALIKQRTDEAYKKGWEDAMGQENVPFDNSKEDK